jgi:hypothetical protein
VWAEADAAASAQLILRLSLTRASVCGLELWVFKERIFIPASASDIVHHVIDAFHRAGGSVSLHQSAGKAQMMLNASGYFIPNFTELFTERTASCSCRVNVAEPRDAKGGFLPFPQFAVRERLFLDWASIPVESTEGYNHICVVMDSASRLCSLFAMRGAPKASDSAAVLADWAGFADFPLSVSVDGAVVDGHVKVLSATESAHKHVAT